MKLSFIICLLTFLQVSAALKAQKINLDRTNAPLKEVLNEIHNQSGYNVLYNAKMLKNASIDIHLINASLDEALQHCFKDQPFSYIIKKNTIVIVPVNKPAAPLAQDITVTGHIVDDSNQPLPGVGIKIKGTNVGATTDSDGNFNIKVPNAKSILVFTFIGFETQEVEVGSQTKLNIKLKAVQAELGEVVVVGYGTQKKATVTGSVVSISSKDLSTTKSQNVQNMLTGKMPGVRVVQKTSEPGEFNNQFDIRGLGTPLVIIDGVPRDNVTRMDANEIESISVLKDASAAVYGVRAANGVVLITTKKGSGKAKIEYSTYYGFQQAIGLPKPVGAIDRFTLANEKNMHKTPDAPTLIYDDDDFAPYLNGTKQSTDWYDLVLRSAAPQYQHNISTSGSTSDNNINYFINLGYSNQDGLFESKSLNYNRYNLRSNVGAQISKRLKASLNLSGILDQRNSPFGATWQEFAALWRAQSSESAYANNNPGYLFATVADNPIAFGDADISGYNKNKSNWLQSQFSLEYQVPYLEGLTAKGMFSYDRRYSDNTSYKKSYNIYTYDAATNIYTPSAKNLPDQLTRTYGSLPSTLMQLSLNYTKSFSNHNISALGLYEESVYKSDTFFGSRELGLPIEYLFAGKTTNQVANSDINGIYETANKAVVGKFNYNYKGKYLAEFSFRLDGSSKFPASKQWVLFPGGSIGWRISEESFIKDNSSLSFINNIKIRGSYGLLGDDGALSNQFVPGFDYPYNGNSQALPGGYPFGNDFVNAIGFRPYPNANITWSTSKMANIGLDAELWKGKLGITVDVFRRKRENLLASRSVSVPGTFGSAFSQENLNSDQTSGVELALSNRSKIGELGFNIGGSVSLTRTKILYNERSPSGNSYDNWRNNRTNRYNDVWFGQGYIGQFQSFDQIRNSPIFTNRTTLPGDYIYEDWNGDGVIDGMDDHPIATSINPNAPATTQSGPDVRQNYPLLNFGLNLGVVYKGFDLNMLFQGGAMSYVSYGEQLQEPLAFDGNALDVFMDRWHPADPKADPFNPATQWIPGYYAYTGTTANPNSERGIQNGSYVRLKSAELGYTFPKNLVSKLGVNAFRIYANGYNVFTITGVKGLDPEHPGELWGYMYPISRTINFGASITF